VLAAANNKKEGKCFIGGGHNDEGNEIRIRKK
jgi:hypothetical protein